MAELRIRQAVRGLLHTPEREILLTRLDFPARTVWALPGGGLDPGEDHLTALRRELIEEVGLRDPEIGPHIWNREHIIPFIDGRWDGQRDRVYAIPTERFDPVPALSWETLNAEYLFELRWWSIGDLEAVEGTNLAPAALPWLLRKFFDDGPPPEPIDTGA